MVNKKVIKTFRQLQSQLLCTQHVMYLVTKGELLITSTKKLETRKYREYMANF